MSLLEELRRRNVFRVGIAYLVGAWILAQVAELLLGTFQAPPMVMKSILAVLIIGFPVALFLAWAFELTPEGVKPEAQVDRSQSVTRQTGRKLDRLIIAFLAVAVVFLLLDRFTGVNGPDAGSEAKPAPAEAVTPDRDSDAEGSGPKRPATIAVLPFVNMSSDPEQEYFSDGITEEVLNRLASVRGLRVAARTSAFSFKGHNEDVREIARQLGVGNILEGSVRKAGDQVRITAQLIRASDGFHLWSESYDRKLENIFAIQDDIANEIAGALEISLGIAGLPADRPAKLVNPEVYDLYLRARALHRRRGAGELQAIELFKQALAVDPEFAPAWAGLSHSYIVLPAYVSVAELGHFGDVGAESMAAAEKALELDPNLPSALHAMGNNLLYQYEWARAEEYYRRALQIDPDSADIMEDYSSLLLWSWQIDAAQRVSERMNALDPNVPVYLAVKIQLEQTRGEFGERDKTLLQALTINPDLAFLQTWNIFRLLQYRDFDGARADALHIGSSGLNSEEMMELIDWMGEPQSQPKSAVVDALRDMCTAPLLVGRYDVWLAAVESLGRIWSQWELQSTTDLLSPIVAPEQMHQYRADPRTKAWLSKIGLPEYWRNAGWPEVCQPVGDDDFECR